MEGCPYSNDTESILKIVAANYMQGDPLLGTNLLPSEPWSWGSELMNLFL